MSFYFLQTPTYFLQTPTYFLQTPTSLLTNPDFTSYKPRLHFLQTPTYKIIFLDLFKIYVPVYQFIRILLLYFIFICEHLLLLFLLIKLDNVRSSLFCLSLSFTIFFRVFFLLTNPEFYSTPFSIFITASMYASFFKSLLIFLFRRLEVLSYPNALYTFSIFFLFSGDSSLTL